MRRDREYFAEWLDRTLTEQGIAGGEVARALEVNDSAVSRWRNGKASPGLDSIRKLAGYLEINPVALAVTAGLMSESEVETPRLPLPEDRKRRSSIKYQIAAIRGLTTVEKEMLIKAYESAPSEREV